MPIRSLAIFICHSGFARERSGISKFSPSHAIGRVLKYYTLCLKLRPYFVSSLEISLFSKAFAQLKQFLLFWSKHHCLVLYHIKYAVNFLEKSANRMKHLFIRFSRVCLPVHSFHKFE